MSFGRRAFLGGALLLGAGLAAGGDPTEVKALAALRAKIKWDSDLPRSLAGREQNAAAAYAFWRDGVIARQSNSDLSREQVLTSTQFTDVVTFTSSLDIPRAAIRVSQPTFGVAKSVHVRVSALGLGPSTEILIDPRLPDEPAIFAGQPVEVTIVSGIPVESQQSRRGQTPRTFTSIVQVVERVSATSRAWRTLNKPLLVRTELQPAAWATSNGRPTPTAIARA
jgi:hypothetical protein